MKNLVNIILLFLLFLFSTKVNAKQDEIVLKLIQKKSSCSPDYFFTNKEINSSQSFNIYTKAFLKSQKKVKYISPELAQNLNLIPVNNCIFRGNRNFVSAEAQKLFTDLQITQIITTDSLTNKLSSNNKKYIYLPIENSKYPNRKSLKSIVKSLEILANASEEQKVYISCFFGKHRTGLVIGLYQFIRNYAQNKELTCSQVGTKRDKSFLQMNNIASLGILTYDMPEKYREFYLNFANSVCKEKSQEFIESF